MEIETAVRRQLLDTTEVTGYVGNRIHPYRLEERVDPAGLRAIVIYRGPAWSPSDTHENAGSEYPTLIVDCWADHSRDVDGEIIRTDHVQNAYAVWRAAHRVLHNPRRGRVWGRVGSNPGVLVVTSTLWFSATHMEGHGVRTGTPLGEAAVVTATYAMHIATLTPVG